MFLSLSLSRSVSYGGVGAVFSTGAVELSLSLSPTVALVMISPQEPKHSLSLSLGDHLVTDACIA